MQPRNLPDADPVEPPAALVLDPPAVADELVELLALDELLPHAAISRVAAPAATATANEVCLTFPPLDRIPDAQA
jgi:hypothetical protein